MSEVGQDCPHIGCHSFGLLTLWHPTFDSQTGEGRSIDNHAEAIDRFNDIIRNIQQSTIPVNREMSDVLFKFQDCDELLPKPITDLLSLPENSTFATAS